MTRSTIYERSATQFWDQLRSRKYAPLVRMLKAQPSEVTQQQLLDALWHDDERVALHVVTVISLLEPTRTLNEHTQDRLCSEMVTRLDEVDTSTTLRSAICRALPAFGKTRALGALRHTLGAPSPTVRAAAVGALAALGATELAPTLRARAQRDRDKGVRKRALFALIRLKDRDSIPLLIDALESDDNSVRENAALALTSMLSFSALLRLLSRRYETGSVTRRFLRFVIERALVQFDLKEDTDRERIDRLLAMKRRTLAEPEIRHKTTRQLLRMFGPRSRSRSRSK